MTTTTTDQDTLVGEEWGSRSLAGSFITPPFNSLSAQKGEWQSRKRLWIELLGLGRIEDLGRDAGLISGNTDKNPVRQPNFYKQKTEWEAVNGRRISTAEFKQYYVPSGNERIENTTSQFDPVLAEVMVTWFSAPGWPVFDPFGGGVERGLVAAYLGRPYYGVELRQEQVDANTRLAERLVLPERALWITGDARDSRALMAGYPRADFVITCPPYWDLEKYDGGPNDVSMMSLPDFLAAMDNIIEATLALLNNDRFAVMVMGDRRYGQRRQWAHLPSAMIKAFERHGALLHNNVVMLTSLGSKPQIARYAFERRRTLMPLYENVLVFVKGDAGAATEALGAVALTEEQDFIAGGGQYRML